jgi:hypothetical protein
MGNEAGEVVEIVELLEFGHRISMTTISPEGKRAFPWKKRGNMDFKSEKLPTRKPEEPLME